MTDALRVVGLVGSPMRPSRSRRLVEHAISVAEEQGVPATLIDLTTIPADALLGRESRDGAQEALGTVMQATVVYASTPTYRASYSGLLKCFLDLLPDDALVGKVAVPIATGTDHEDLRAAGQALRTVFTSLGASIVAAGAYATDADFVGGEPSETALRRIAHAVAESLRSAQQLRR